MQRNQFSKQTLCFALTVLQLLFICNVKTVNRDNFKTCEQSGFCTRQRDGATNGGAAGGRRPRYNLQCNEEERDALTIHPETGKLHGWLRLDRKHNDGGTVSDAKRLQFELSHIATPPPHTSGSGSASPPSIASSDTFRLRILQDPSVPRRSTPRLSLPVGHTLEREPRVHRFTRIVAWKTSGPEVDSVNVTSSAASPFTVSINCRPFQLDVLEQKIGAPLIRVNSEQLLKFEVEDPRDDSSSGTAASSPSTSDDGNGDASSGSSSSDTTTTPAPPPPANTDRSESFGSHRDSRPNGDESIGLDIRFSHGFHHAFGLPEHADTLQLRSTRPISSANSGSSNPARRDTEARGATHSSATGSAASDHSQPYRLYNLDVFEYELDSPMALYAAVPLVWVQRAATPSAGKGGEAAAAGVFWNNPSETWVDVDHNDGTAEGAAGGVGGLVGGMFSKLLGGGGGGDAENATQQDGGANQNAGEATGTAWNSDAHVTTHWMSETGQLDVFLFVAKSTPAATADTVDTATHTASPLLDLMTSYAQLTGFSKLPPLWALGYHQCRWNYNDEEDVREVVTRLDAARLSNDVIWLDIEHTNGKRYFTWDAEKFPNPSQLVDWLDARGRKLVTVVDPHMKRDSDWSVYSRAAADNLMVRNADGQGEYEGHCWPGPSSWPDFVQRRVRTWWAQQFPQQPAGRPGNVFTWNDMNEPSVFSGPEITMHKDMRHRIDVDEEQKEEKEMAPSNKQTQPAEDSSSGEAGTIPLEHRQIHNMFGVYVHQASAEGQLLRSAKAVEIGTSPPPSTDADNNSNSNDKKVPDTHSHTLSHAEQHRGVERPFVLTRSSFAGGQRHYTAIWTGDNKADWSHLRASIPMLLNLGLAGFAFAGADVSGFFGNPDAELQTRWLQLGAYTPFFRSHAHMDTRRREPYLLDETHLAVVRDAIAERYRLLPYVYTQFQVGPVARGWPLMAPLWLEFPADARALRTEDEFMLGACLLVKPIAQPGATQMSVYLPGHPRTRQHGPTWWYSWPQLSMHRGGAHVELTGLTLVSPPAVFYRAGCVVPRKERRRRASTMTRLDPFTLIVAATPEERGTARGGAAASARGHVFIDDYHRVNSASHLFTVHYEGGRIWVTEEKQQRNRAQQQQKAEEQQQLGTKQIERIIVLGVKRRPGKVLLHRRGGDTKKPALPVEHFYEESAGVLVVRRAEPNFELSPHWTIEISPPAGHESIHAATSSSTTPAQTESQTHANSGSTHSAQEL